MKCIWIVPCEMDNVFVNSGPNNLKWLLGYFRYVCILDSIANFYVHTMQGTYKVIYAILALNPNISFFISSNDSTCSF